MKVIGRSEKMQKLDGYIDIDGIKEKFGEKEIFIYGTGVDAECFMKKCNFNITIKGFVDRYRAGNKYQKKDIITPNQYLSCHKGVPVVIMSYRFALEIKESLSVLGLVFGQDFFIYDNDFYFHSDQITEEFINFNVKRWFPYKVDKSESIVLIPFDNRHDTNFLLCAAYAANYWAKKTQSQIYAYFRVGAHYINVIDNFKRIYQSLNVVDIVDDSLSEKQQQIVKELTKNLWSTIHTWEDWKSITVHGICFGTTILRHMMRSFVPPLEADDIKLLPFLEKSLGYIEFWYDFFNSNKVNLVILDDGVCWDGYIRDISITHGIPTYNSDCGFSRMTKDFSKGGSIYPYAKFFWDKLSTEEKKKGIEWARQILLRRISGLDKDLASQGQNDKNTFSYSIRERVLEKNNNIKILICPHIFEEDSYQNGDFLFSNSYISWLTHLGNLSNTTSNYDWYLKMHPNASKRDFIIIDKLLKKYPRIKKLDSNISPRQLKSEGVSLALTISGTIAYEYPLIGIEVVNAGNNPGVAFDFAWNPKTIKEYDSLLLNAANIIPKNNNEQIFQCFAIWYLYYDWNSFHVPLKFCDNRYFYMSRNQLQAIGMDFGTWKYKIYMDECTDERHEQIMKSIPDVLKKADSWKPDVFYKRKQ